MSASSWVVLISFFILTLPSQTSIGISSEPVIIKVFLKWFLATLFVIYSEIMSINCTLFPAQDRVTSLEGVLFAKSNDVEKQYSWPFVNVLNFLDWIFCTYQTQDIHPDDIRVPLHMCTCFLLYVPTDNSLAIRMSKRLHFHLWLWHLCYRKSVMSLPPSICFWILILNDQYACIQYLQT